MAVSEDPLPNICFKNGSLYSVDHLVSIFCSHSYATQPMDFKGLSFSSRWYNTKDIGRKLFV